jgi:hypothetical protein
VRLAEPIAVGSLTMADRNQLMRDTRESVVGMLGGGESSTESR